ncbi:MBG domain-containing protein [Pontibacter sp. E15-1]|uniref:MBG domain-containing protein n=1 Tax=Pontibacter sp. E15-1 TaxID=2919918 RepID=UPI001F4FEA82|nr:MBG domain-containing protein [Pontibacter sp. E15-1]MCJ8163682.1 MBG domain-containing protein [Pontibacter sp. E15-1]
MAATASSGLPVSYGSSGVLSHVGTTYTMNSGTGSGTVSYSQEGNANYNAATVVTETVSASKAAQTISFEAITSKTFGDAPFAIAPSASSGLQVVISTSGGVSYNAQSGLVSITGAGPASITAAQAGNDNYQAAVDKVIRFEVNKAAATLSLANLSHTYDGTSKSATASTVPANLAGVSISNNGKTEAGKYTVTASLDNANYEAESVSRDLVIGKADQVITWAVPVAITYGTALSDTQLNAEVAGIAGGSAPGALTYNPSAGVKLSAGSHTLSVTAAATTNYNAASETVAIVVHKATPEIAWSDLAAITYGTDLDGKLNATASFRGHAVAGSFDYKIGATVVTRYTMLNAAALPYAIDVTFTPNDSNNYTGNTGQNTLTVNKAELTVKANDITTPTQYSDMLPAFGYTITGFVNGDNSDVVSGVPTLSTTASLSSTRTAQCPAGTYNIVPNISAMAAANYSCKAVAGSFTVTEEDATIAYSGLDYFSTGSASSNTAKVTLSAVAQDIADANRGKIVSNAVIDFRTGNTISAPAVNSAALSRAIGYISTNDDTQGMATSETFSYTLSGSDANNGGSTITFYPMVNKVSGGSYYTGVGDAATITIAIPGQDNITGGGSLVAKAPMGTLANGSVKKVNFGFTMKYNKSGKNLMGQANIIFRTAGGVNYQIKSNAINSLVLSDYKNGATVVGKKAVFNTKANLTNLLDGTSLGGNMNLTVEVVEATVAGYKDMFSVKLTDPAGGLLYASNWNGTTSALQDIAGGKISVRGTSTLSGASTASLVSAAPGGLLPDSRQLLNYPNPYHDRTAITFSTQAEESFVLEVYDVKGALVRKMDAGVTEAGKVYTYDFDSRSLPEGVYIARLITASDVQTLKMVLKK